MSQFWKVLRFLTLDAKWETLKVFLGVSCVACATQLPQTLLLERYKSIVACYKNGKPQPLSEDINLLSQEVVERIKLSAQKQSRLDIFLCYGNDPLHRGAMSLTTGALVGIPLTFLYKTEADIPKDSYQVDRQKVDANEGAAQTLFDSVLLSENAKAFAIARELYYVNFNYVACRAAMQTFVFLGPIGLAAMFNRFRREGGSTRKPWVSYAVVGTVALVVYLFSHDTFSCMIDNRVDRQAARLGLDYAEGGVEYYHKVLERNKALRNLMGHKGSKLFTIYGNQVWTFRRKSVPLTERREHLMKCLKEMQEEEQRPRRDCAASKAF